MVRRRVGYCPLELAACRPGRPLSTWGSRFSTFGFSQLVCELPAAHLHALLSPPDIAFTPPPPRPPLPLPARRQHHARRHHHHCAAGGSATTVEHFMQGCRGRKRERELERTSEWLISVSPRVDDDGGDVTTKARHRSKLDDLSERYTSQREFRLATVCVSVFQAPELQWSRLEQVAIATLQQSLLSSSVSGLAACPNWTWPT